MASKKQLKKRIRKLKRQLKKSKASYYDLYEIHSEWDEERWMENKGLMDRIAELEEQNVEVGRELERSEIWNAVERAGIKAVRDEFVRRG